MTRATFKKGDKLERWERNLENPRRALKQIGAIMVAESKRAFREQQHGNDDWDERAVPNVYGIIADFAQGAKSPKKRRFDSRPALKDPGRLSASIAAKVYGRSVVIVGSNLEYAGVMHAGGPIESETISSAVQRALWKWLKKKGKAWASDLGFLLNKKYTGETLKGVVEPRPFVGITKSTIEDVREIVGLELMEAR